jgi:tripartite-type tricarboxylate transporter receptor subunit TctC
MNRRYISAALLGMAVLSSTSLLPAHAQGNFPSSSVRLIVPFAPGGSSDSSARILAEQLSAIWKQPVVIDNKPGANGSIAASIVAKAPADGLTLLYAPVSIGTVSIFLRNPGFDPLKDLAPISLVVEGDYVLSVNKSLPVNSMGEFADYVRKNPGKVFHGTFGGGSMLAFEQFSDSMKFKVENVGYRGEALALSALVSGDVQAVLSTLTAARPFIEAGRIKPLGIPSKIRSTIAPSIRTADESGAKGFNVNFWFGLMTPTGTPKVVIDRINSDVAQALSRTEVKGRMYAMGLIARPTTSQEFGRIVKFESERWVEVAKRAGVEAQ